MCANVCILSKMENKETDTNSPINSVPKASNTHKSPSKLYSTVHGALLGSSELVKCLPNKEIVLQITTWNTGSLPLPKDTQLRAIFSDKDTNADIHVIAIQESWPDTDASEVLFQLSLGPGYCLFHSIAFGTLHLCIFIRRDLVWYTSGMLLNVTQ
jgi:hypothetical protein